jgi:hypothetical protein
MGTVFRGAGVGLGKKPEGYPCHTLVAQFGAESFSAEPFVGPNTFEMGNYLM